MFQGFNESSGMNKIRDYILDNKHFAKRVIEDFTGYTRQMWLYQRYCGTCSTIFLVN